QWGGTRSTFTAVHRNKIRLYSGFHHRFANGYKFTSVTDTQLKSNGLSARQFTQLLYEFQQPNRCRKRAVERRRVYLLAHFYQADTGYLRSNFDGRQDAAMTGFRHLRQFDFNHFYTGMFHLISESFRIEIPVMMPAAEIAGTDLPPHITTTFEVVFGKPPFAGIMIKPPNLSTLIQRHDGIFAQRTVTHRRNVENTAGVGLFAVWATHGNTGVLINLEIVHRRDAMAQPFIVIVINIQLGSEWRGVQYFLGALVNHAPEHPAKRAA